MTHDDEVLAQFEELCRSATASDLQRLGRRVAMHINAIEEHQFENESLDLELAHKIAASLAAMIDVADELTAEQRSWVCGAADYFVLTSDAADDLVSPDGLVDDAQVVNVAANKLGRQDLLIDLPTL